MNVTGKLPFLAVLSVAACAHLPVRAPEARTGEAQLASVVRIETTCGSRATRSGAGVIVSERHVLTAAHIVSCPSMPTVRVFYKDDKGERRLRMAVTSEDKQADLARLEILSAEKFSLAAPPVVRLPDPGNNVCTPAADKPCGTVASTWTVVKRMSTTKAHVGAPVYDTQGTLVGIVTSRGDAGAWQYTWIAPIENRWLDGIVPAERERVEPSVASREL